jgi:hypothetical protein
MPPGFVVALLAISKAKLKRIVDTATSCLSHFYVPNSEHTGMPCITILPLVLVKDSFIRFINVLGIPKLYNILYNSFLLIL